VKLHVPHAPLATVVDQLSSLLKNVMLELILMVLVFAGLAVLVNTAAMVLNRPLLNGLLDLLVVHLLSQLVTHPMEPLHLQQDVLTDTLVAVAISALLVHTAPIQLALQFHVKPVWTAECKVKSMLIFALLDGNVLILLIQLLVPKENTL
jgi:hypothetical protein